MSTVVKEKPKAISIEYLPTERELDPSTKLVVGEGMPDTFKIVEELGYKTFYGVKRYICGLDVEMVERNDDLTPEEKKAKIEEIKKTVERLEKFYGPGQLDPTNEHIWSKVRLELDRKTTNLDLTNPRTELIVYCIKAGGFNVVAPNIDAARENNVKFYLVEPVELAESKVTNTKIINKAISTLDKIDETKSQDELFYIAKYIMPVEKGYNRSTPKAMLYSDLNEFINGNVVKLPRVRCAAQFLEVTKKPKADLVISCLVKDGLDFGFLYTNPAGEIKNNETAGVYGTTIERAVAHLQNPNYESELDNLKSRVEKRWLE
jgi:hypothetical protein